MSSLTSKRRPHKSFSTVVLRRVDEENLSVSTPLLRARSLTREHSTREPSHSLAKRVKNLVVRTCIFLSMRFRRIIFHGRGALSISENFLARVCVRDDPL